MTVVTVLKKIIKLYEETTFIPKSVNFSVKNSIKI